MDDFDRALSRFCELTKQRSVLKDELAGVESELNTLNEVLTEHFGYTGTQSVKRDGLTIYRARELRVSVRAGMKAEAVQWAKDHGDEHLITLQPQSLKSMVREMLDDGSLPDDLREFVWIDDGFKLRARKS